MKKNVRSAVALILVLLLALSFSACGKKESTPPELWDSAAYKADTELGEGNRTVSVAVKAENKTVTFTIHTDAETVGTALLDQNLISGEAGAYGMYIKSANGITADYDIDQSYWAFYINGEYATAGVDATEITEGAEYQLVYSK